MDPLVDITNDSYSLNNSLNYLSTTSQIIHCILLFIYFVFGIVGNTLNIFLFTLSLLSRTSSSRYLLSACIGDLLVTVFVIPLRFFADGFNLDLTSYSLFSCRLVSYLYYVTLTLPLFFTVLATADRWAASCVQVNRRRFANMNTTKRLIPIGIIVCCLLYIHIFMTFDISLQPPPPYCSVADLYSVPILSLQLMTYSVIPPFFMAFFSIGIIRNTTHRENRIAPAVQLANPMNTNTVIRRKRRNFNQMQVMLVCQATVECVLTLPFSLMNLASIVIDNDDQFLTIYSFLRLITFVNYISSFYIYMLSSKLYRDELKKLVRRLLNRRQ